MPDAHPRPATVVAFHEAAEHERIKVWISFVEPHNPNVFKIRFAHRGFRIQMVHELGAAMFQIKFTLGFENLPRVFDIGPAIVYVLKRDRSMIVGAFLLEFLRNIQPAQQVPHAGRPGITQFKPVMRLEPYRRGTKAEC
jgi:hypothetical protein